MKKRWGKPITQVQRFVPQFCQNPCVTYNLRPLTASDISGETNFSMVRIDIVTNQHIETTLDKERIGTLNGSGYVNDVFAQDVTNQYKDLFYEWTYKGGVGYDQYEAPNFKYTDQRYYKHLSVSVNLYLYESHIYTGEKNIS